MQHTDDFNHVNRFLTIENNVAASAMFAIAAANFAAILTFKRVGGQLMEVGIQQCKIGVALFATPLVLGVATDLFQISDGLIGKGKTGHHLRLSLSISSIRPFKV